MANATVASVVSGISCLELVLHPMAMCLSAFNMALMANTALLHANLKCILVGQSIAIFVSELARLTFVLCRMANDGSSTFWASGLAFSQMLGLFSNTFRNFVVHVELAERALATLKFRTYEQCKMPKMNAAWISAMLSLCVWIVISQNGSAGNVEIASIVCFCIGFCVGLVEILIIIIIYNFNLQLYQNPTHLLTLNERFQLSENIRTARQLRPTFVLQFANFCVTKAPNFLIYFQVMGPNYMMPLCFGLQCTIAAAINMLIELTVICNHPATRRKAVLWLAAKPCGAAAARVSTSANLELKEYGNENQAKNIHGQTLIAAPSNEQDHHFRMLAECWERR